MTYEIAVVGRHIEVTDAMKDYAKEKVHKIDKISDRVIKVTVTMDIQKLVHRVDIVMDIENTKVKVHATSDDMYASVDKATDRLQAKIRRYHSKLHEHHAKGLPIKEMPVEVIAAPVDEINDEIEEENLRKDKEGNGMHAIDKQVTRPLKTLTGEEAIMKMELSGDGFMIFRNEIDQKLKVIYRRKDGNFGLIAPE